MPGSSRLKHCRLPSTLSYSIRNADRCQAQDTSDIKIGRGGQTVLRYRASCPVRFRAEALTPGSTDWNLSCKHRQDIFESILPRNFFRLDSTVLLGLTT